MSFKMAPWNCFVVFATWIVASSVLYVTVSAFYRFLLSAGSSDFSDVFVMFIVLLLFLAFYIVGPRGYEINSKGVIIKRLVKDICIPRKNVYSVEILKNVKLIRTVGNGGLFGYYGTYMDTDGSTVKVYATRFDCMVRLKTEDIVYYFSPKEPEVFMQAIEELIKETG